MKIEIEKKDLMAVLSKTQNIVEKRNTMPVLLNVLIEASNDKIKLFATDLEVSLTDEAKATIIQPGKAAINAKNLFEIVKELSDTTIQLTKKENNWLEIKQNKSVFNIVGISAEEYPVFPSYSTQEFMKINAKVLSEMIEKTIFSVSTDETRYHLNGVYFEHYQNEGKAYYRMVATDGHRLSVIDKDALSTVSKHKVEGVIIPRKGLFEIKKILDVIDGEFEMAIEGSQLIARHGSTTLMVRLIEGKYPNYQQFIPKNLGKKVRLNKDQLVSSLKRVSLLSNQKYKGVTLALMSGRLEISTNSPELGDAKEELDVAYQGTDLKIGFNAKYILDVLNNLDDSEIDLNLNDQLSPGMLRPHNDSSYTCVIMPMRI